MKRWVTRLNRLRTLTLSSLRCRKHVVSTAIIESMLQASRGRERKVGVPARDHGYRSNIFVTDKMNLGGHEQQQKPTSGKVVTGSSTRLDFYWF